MSNLAYEPVGPGDLVFVSVADCPEATRSYRLSDTGMLTLALLDEPLHAQGLTNSELEIRIAEQLKRAHILVKPSVSVSVLEYRSRPVNVVGAVKHSLTFQALGDVKLLDAIARADGFAPEAGPEVLIQGSSDNAVDTRTVRHISIKQLLSGADPALNILLHGGEEIRVPEAQKLYIVGNVRNPGGYPLNETGKATLLQALALCQGTLPYSRKIAYLYRTQPGTSERQEIPVELDAILKRKALDIVLQPNDILYIQDNSGKRATMATLDHLAGFGSSTASGLIVFK